MKKLLIISNNPLSEVQNNGKTILSMIEELDCDCVRQLYFNINNPTIVGYKYFRISDQDIIRGLLRSDNRGAEVIPKNSKENNVILETPISIRNNIFRFFRELLWHKKWKSRRLIEWLNEFNPEAIFFVGGDCVFAYDIALEIQKMFNSRLSLYITDDYILKREKDSIIGILRKKWIVNRIRDVLKVADSFFTISEKMRETYLELFGKDSRIICNIPESMKRDDVKGNSEYIELIYAGSLYYGREDTISMLVDVLSDYNETHTKKARLSLYCNSKPDDAVLRKVCKDTVSHYGGSLSKDELITELNKADILVFAESFQKSEIEKVRLSFSTKIPEYLSIGKPVLALGPSGIGSMDFLEDVAECVNDPEYMKDRVYNLLNSDCRMIKLGRDSKVKFEKAFNRERMQLDFQKTVLGEID